MARASGVIEGRSPRFGASFARILKRLGVLTSLRTVTTNTIVVAADAGGVIEANSASTITVTVQNDSSTYFPINTVIEVARIGAGSVTIVAGSGVTLRSRGSLLNIGNQYGSVGLRKRAPNEWVVTGDLA